MNEKTLLSMTRVELMETIVDLRKEQLDTLVKLNQRTSELKRAYQFIVAAKKIMDLSDYAALYYMYLSDDTDQDV